VSDFMTTLTLSIEGVEAEHVVFVRGHYLRAEAAYVPRGEYAAVDPPEPADFELSGILINLDDGRPFDIFPLLSEAQVDAIVAQGIENGEPQEDPDDARDRMIEDRDEKRGWYTEW
jgi:hypothetical protein